MSAGWRWLIMYPPPPASHEASESLSETTDGGVPAAV
jgi:hypothetical protein